MKKPYETVSSVTSQFLDLYGEITNEQISRYENLFARFKKEFSKENAYICSSSGRVEICGNHTDHNGGKVLSSAISLDSVAMFLPTEDNKIYVNSEGYKPFVVDINSIENTKVSSSESIVKGVVKGFIERGYKVGGFCASVTSNVVGGAGISSSASFEVLICEILNFLYNDGKVSCEDKAKISQFAENVYFNKPCGLLDQTAISFGGLNLLDFSNKNKIGVTKIKNELNKNYTLVLIKTGGSHANLTDEYASIPKEMFNVANKVGVERLVDIGEEEFLDKLSKCEGYLDREVTRAVHFFEENKRVERAKEYLENNNFEGFLNEVKNSGNSSLGFLQNCYVAKENSQLITKALAISSVYNSNGAYRVHGGGFAGTMLNIVKNDNLESFINNITKFYEEENVIVVKCRDKGTIIL
ncbi:MAG: galactokinase [Clostridia bacterium]|nr:galactokinase [Clostridia bacterium]